MNTESVISIPFLANLTVFNLDYADRRAISNTIGKILLETIRIVSVLPGTTNSDLITGSKDIFNEVFKIGKPAMGDTTEE